MRPSFAEAEKLVEQIESRLAGRKATGERRIIFIPFTEQEDFGPNNDQETSVRWGKELDKKYLTLRVFASEVQRLVNTRAHSSLDAVPENCEIDKANLIKEFESLSHQEKEEVLNKVASKRPVIVTPETLQQGELEITAEDSIEIAGHGSREFDYIISNGNKLTAKEVLDRLTNTFEGQTKNIQKIKLTSCGSGHLFIDAFHEEVKKRGQDFDLNATLHGYNKGAFLIPRIERALEDLASGNHFIGDKNDLLELRKLYQRRDDLLNSLSSAPHSSEITSRERIALLRDSLPDSKAEIERLKIEGASVLNDLQTSFSRLEAGEEYTDSPSEEQIEAVQENLVTAKANELFEKESSQQELTSDEEVFLNAYCRHSAVETLLNSKKNELIKVENELRDLDPPEHYGVSVRDSATTGQGTGGFFDIDSEINSLLQSKFKRASDDGSRTKITVRDCLRPKAWSGSPSPGEVLALGAEVTTTSPLGSSSAHSTGTGSSSSSSLSSISPRRKH